ncbi:uncharacterized protein N0V89_010043 [Didymosphaeria variabile]|uniref:SnoaL-like domain-containing protein n=1 Tax=Didymosphaeria variabile TaxID=1932322 RepID=A0A9W8XF32_9PLEO|nr:uncharacterized protein N0V89_010043 [Didymosphaeria variabile]KAJ4348665.1 hypothetical protein N0V89_010043 [Didymosphaeria variabile]
MKLFPILSSTALFLSGVHAIAAGPSTREAITDTLLTFYRSLDLKSESLLRSTTTPDLVFDGTAFASIGVGAPDPMVGQDVIAPALIASLPMTTSHNLANLRVVFHLEGAKANVTAYVLAYHYKLLSEPAESTSNVYLMSNFVEGLARRESGVWKLERVRLEPFFQSGNLEVMGLGA